MIKYAFIFFALNAASVEPKTSCAEREHRAFVLLIHRAK